VGTLQRTDIVHGETWALRQAAVSRKRRLNCCNQALSQVCAFHSPLSVTGKCKLIFVNPTPFTECASGFSLPRSGGSIERPTAHEKSLLAAAFAVLALSRRCSFSSNIRLICRISAISLSESCSVAACSQSCNHSSFLFPCITTYPNLASGRR